MAGSSLTTGRLHPGHLLLVLLAALVLALGLRAFEALRAPLPLPPPMQPPALADRALMARFDPFFPTVAGSSAALPVTALPFSLHGIRADSATGRGSAIIAAGEGRQAVYSVGDDVGEGVTLAAIAGDHVVLERDGRRETLWLDSAGGETVQRYDANAVGAMPSQAVNVDGVPESESDVPEEAERPSAPAAELAAAPEAEPR